MNDATFTQDPLPYLIVPNAASQTGNGCTQPNCTAWSPPFPQVTCSGELVNGGVPQAGNLSLHLQYIREHIDAWLPDKAFSGNAVFDLEAWSPRWGANVDTNCWYHSIHHQNLSTALVRAEHPAWSPLEQELAAAQAFEAAALAFLAETLRLCTALRPNASWGFYGLPDNPYLPCSASAQCGYNNPVAGPFARALNDELAPLWAASTGFFPSIYIPEGANRTAFDAAANADYIAGVTAEAARLRDAHAPSASMRVSLPACAPLPGPTITPGTPCFCQWT